MKLLRHGPAGQEKPGLLDRQGHIRDLSAHVADITAETLSPAGLAALCRIDVQGLPRVSADVRLGVPWRYAGKIICVGLNYRSHAEETAHQIPAEPVLFSKWCRPTGANDPVRMPRGACKMDWEVELGVVIGTEATDVRVEEAMPHVAGYCVFNDVSERHFQMERGGTWDKGKGCDTFAPAGPWLVTADEVPQPQALELWLDVNGERQQQANTRDMLFGVAKLVSYISQFTTLYPGDLLATGTPAGVGLGQQPPRFLRQGDVMTLGIEGLGTQCQHVIS